MRRRVLLSALAAACLAAACSSTRPSGAPAPPAGTVRPAPDAAGWLTYDHDAQRSGEDAAAPPARNVRADWVSPPLDGAVYAQPLVTDHAVIVATENDSVYSLNTSDGAVQWERHLASPVRGSSLPCGNVDPSGITGTPVIDPASALVWAVTFSSGPYAHTLWALRLSDGTIAASRPADPLGSDPATDQQRGALTLTAGRVYVPYGGLYGDCGSYHGRLFGVTVAGTGLPPVSYSATAERAGIWSPPGATLDNAGDLLVATGNGLPVDPPGGANSVIRLTPDLNVVASFTAPDSEALSQSDTDLGSTSPTVTPGGDVFQVGKEGVGYLLSPDLKRTLSTTRVCSGGFGGTAVAASSIFLSCFDGLYALALTRGAKVTVRWRAVPLQPGPPVVAGGVVWTVDRAGHLDGFDARSGALVYTHPVSVAGSFPSPAAADGKLYVPSGRRVAAFTGI